MKKDKLLKSIIIVWALLLIILQLILYLINYFGVARYNYIFWSILHFKPTITPVIYSLIVLLMLVIIAFFSIHLKILNWLREKLNGIKIKRKYLFFVAISILFLPISYLFRIINPVLLREHWGSLIVDQASTDPSRLFFMSAPVTSYLEFIFFKIMSFLFSWNAIKAINVFAVLTSSLYIFILLLFSDILTEDKLKKVMLFLLFISAGFSQLLFGWVQGSVFGVLLMIIFLYVSYLYINKKIKFIYLVLAFWLAFLSYAALFWFIPGLLFLYFLNSNIYKLSVKNFLKGIFNKKFIGFLLLLIIPTILFFIFIEINLYSMYNVHVYEIDKVKVGNLLGGGDGTIFIQLSQTKSNWERFTMFSFGHLTEFLNMNLLLAPFGIILFFSLLLVYRKQINFKNPFIYFMLIITSFFLLFMLTYNLDYLNVKEGWDDYSIIHILFTIINSFILINYAEKNTYEEIALIMIFISFSLSIPWILSNSQFATLIIK